MWEINIVWKKRTWVEKPCSTQIFVNGLHKTLTQLRFIPKMYAWFWHFKNISFSGLQAGDFTCRLHECESRQERKNAAYHWTRMPVISSRSWAAWRPPGSSSCRGRATSPASWRTSPATPDRRAPCSTWRENMLSDNDDRLESVKGAEETYVTAWILVN